MTNRVNWSEARSLSQQCAKSLVDVVTLSNKGQAYVMQYSDDALKQRWIKNLNDYRSAATDIKAAASNIPRNNRDVGVDEFPKFYEVTQILNDRMMFLVEIVAEFHTLLQQMKGNVQ